ncbi:Gfo/Idh/MocA family oxidoreductase [Treponema parvum]|uniref:Gfo/Idh/MocA family oxidoreductase n=2 Tax=Treponema parvum TaxID=138851 RepID=A0A975IDI1_9SPIR|nr:Gfo/Idh/MocA family oxidoreductase [Treponema parvum]QTQ17458.1 Gfo/Idh/MocA family oxidoreductase [Treponema parvum]
MKFAILGAGTIANKMACTISHMPLVEAYAVAARDLDRATEFAARYGFAKAYGSYEEMVEDREVDIVYIAVPHSLHYRYMKLCLEHGKHVLCEKPFTVNAEQTKKIIALAEKNGLLATEAMWTRYMPSRKIVDDIIKSGVIGQVTSLTANLGYELSAIKRIWDINLAGGALWDVGCYLVHFARMIFGTEITDIKASAVFRNDVDAIDSITLLFGDKVATMQCSAVAVLNRNGSIFGTRGYIEIQNINNPELIEVFDSEYHKIATYTLPKQITGFEYEVQASIEAIENHCVECKALPHDEIISSMETLDEIRKKLGYEPPIVE